MLFHDPRIRQTLLFTQQRNIVPHYNFRVNELEELSAHELRGRETQAGTYKEEGEDKPTTYRPAEKLLSGLSRRRPGFLHICGTCFQVKISAHIQLSALVLCFQAAYIMCEHINLFLKLFQLTDAILLMRNS